MLDGTEQVPLLAVDLEDQGGLGQARPDRRGDLGPGHARARTVIALPSGKVMVTSAAEAGGGGHGLSPYGLKPGRTIPTPPRKVKGTVTFPRGR